MAKINPNRTPMGEQAPEIRAHNFEEVALGYSPGQAVAEASRCLVCGKPKCIEGCPVGVNIPEFIKLVSQQKFIDAAQALKGANALPAICGRVCPQESQCEAQCIVGRKGEAVAIGRLERFVADYERTHPEEAAAAAKPVEIAPSGFKAAVIGSGPAGLSCARELAIRGHKVTVYEALHRPGGVLIYGIPEFRLPNDIVDSEIDGLRQLGVEILVDQVIGQTYSLQELFEEEGFDAIFIGTGAGLPKFLGIPGENLKGVVSANEFLTRSNLMDARNFPEVDTPVYAGQRTVVLGAGNVAMDAARTALRLGANEVWIVYRRTREEMPARAEEIHHAGEEGVKFELLSSPLEVIGGDDGWVRGLKLQKMELGEPDDSGRRRPVPIKDSETVFDCDMVINALGSGINQLIFRNAKEIQQTRWGTAVVDEETGATTMPGVFAGGDVAIGAATVILAMGAGKKAAAGIDEYLKGLAPRG